jgi:hypothetical protein
VSKLSARSGRALLSHYNPPWQCSISIYITHNSSLLPEVVGWGNKEDANSAKSFEGQQNHFVNFMLFLTSATIKKYLGILSNFLNTDHKKIVSL